MQFLFLVCPRGCPRTYKPVCGSDGRTYGNQCHLNYVQCRTKGKITKKHDGRCCTNRCSKIKCRWGAKCEFNKKTCRHRCSKNHSRSSVLSHCKHSLPCMFSTQKLPSEISSSSIKLNFFKLFGIWQVYSLDFTVMFFICTSNVLSSNAMFHS